MRDIRDPLDVYNKLQLEMKTHNCTIIEAADRLELHAGLGANGRPNAGAERLPPGAPDVARIVPSDWGA